VLERRTAFERDRTWCLWDVRPHAFDGLASHRWSAWEVAAPGGTARQHSAPHAYVHLDARDVYAHALAELERLGGVEVRLGVQVQHVEPAAIPPLVRTDAGDWTAGRVYDALALGSPLLTDRDPGTVTLQQAFLGWEVELDRPAFDPAVATLMDFRVPQGGGLRFLYVLPFSPTRALVEDTTIGPGGGPPEPEREALLRDWLAVRAGEWTVDHVERGRIPMTDADFPARHGPRVHTVGTGAGAVRPSSGYAFARIQRHCRAVAEAVATGREPPPASAARAKLLDRVFLQALRDDPAAFPEHFRRLVAGTPADAFARFMSDASTPADELRVIAALPKLPFAAAAARAFSPARR
jgi:lycopene beta-cyclase